jgi:histidine phosphotransferase ChpT
MTEPTTAVALDALDLAALLASRVCHDVISPVGAINNGIEVLEDESDEEMRKIAMGLVKKSARQASVKLQFCRLAFGAAGSAGAEIDTGEAEKVAHNYVESDKVTLTWSGPRILLPKNKVKLLLNLVMIALSAIPRGGTVKVEIAGEAPAVRFLVTAHGLNARIPPAVPDLVRGVPHGGVVDGHAIQPYYTGVVARAAAMDVDLRMAGDDVLIEATPA